jgi:putative membrane protein
LAHVLLGGESGAVLADAEVRRDLAIGGGGVLAGQVDRQQPRPSVLLNGQFDAEWEIHFNLARAIAGSQCGRFKRNSSGLLDRTRSCAFRRCRNCRWYRFCKEDDIRPHFTGELVMFRCMVTLGAFLIVGMGVRADDQKKDHPFDDETFVKKAASCGMAEVELGTIAKDKGTSDAVRKYGERLVTDHTKANEDLKAAAKAAGITIPEKMDEKALKHVNHFKDFKGSDFDKDFVKHMIAAHDEAVTLFTQASKEAKNRELREFATKYLPTLKEHLDMAKKLEK